MLVEPAYCAEEKIWFLEDGTTAKTLAELQANNPHFVIEGYCPKGYVPERKTQNLPPEMRRSTRPVLRLTQEHWSFSEKAPAVHRMPQRMSEPTFAEFEEVPEDIAEATFQKPENEELPKLQMYKPAKQREKEAKVRRISEGRLTHAEFEFEPIRWDDERDAWLKQLVASPEKYSAEQIGRIMKCTRNSVIGRCHRKGYQLQKSPKFKKGNRAQRGKF